MEAMPEPKGEGVEEITQKCLDNEGYLLFSAHLSGRRDKKDMPIIDFQYRRYHFSLEDAKQAIGELKKFVDEELERLMNADEG